MCSPNLLKIAELVIYYEANIIKIISTNQDCPLNEKKHLIYNCFTKGLEEILVV